MKVSCHEVFSPFKRQFSSHRFVKEEAPKIECSSYSMIFWFTQRRKLLGEWNQFLSQSRCHVNLIVDNSYCSVLQNQLCSLTSQTRSSIQVNYIVNKDPWHDSRCVVPWADGTLEARAVGGGNRCHSYLICALWCWALLPPLAWKPIWNAGSNVYQYLTLILCYSI